MKKIILFISLFSLLKVSYSQNIWESTSGPEGAEITYTLNINDTVLLVGTQKSSIYKSTNFGEEWELIREGNNVAGNLGTSGMVVTSDDIIFTSLYDGGLFKSTDLGSSWISLNKGPGFLYLTQNDEKLFLLTPREYIKDYFEFSTDFGSSWIVVNLPDMLHQEQFATDINENNWILATLSGVFVSVDSGATWESRNSGLATTYVYSVYINDENETFIGTREGVYYSANFGMGWEHRSQGIPTETRVYDIIEFSDSIMIIGSSRGSFLSYNKGLLWSELSPLINTHRVNSLTQFNRSNLLLGSINSPYILVNSVLHRRSSGIREIHVNILNQTENMLFAGTRLGLFRSKNGGNSWDYQSELEPNIITKIDTDSLNVYYSWGTYGYFWLSSDEGETWDYYSRPGCCTDIISFSNHNITIGVYKWNMYLPPHTGIYYTSNYGNSWVTGALQTIYYIRAFGKDLDENLFIAVESTEYPGNYSIFKSTNYGASAYECNTGLPNTPINSIDTDSGNNIYLGTDLGLYYSTNGGEIWSRLSLDSTKILHILVDQFHNFYARMSGGVYKSSDGGLNFAKFNSGLEGLSLANSLFLSSDNYLYIGTNKGVYRTVDTLTTDIQNGQLKEIIPMQFDLSQNYPNPFNPNTKIKFSIPSVTLRRAQSDIFISLKVYDVLGNKIATLVNEEKSAGNYEIEFNGSGLTSGIYFYQLKADNFVDTKKMLLLK